MCENFACSYNYSESAAIHIVLVGFVCYNESEADTSCAMAKVLSVIANIVLIFQYILSLYCYLPFDDIALIRLVLQYFGSHSVIQ